MQEAAKLRPVVIDESLTDVEALLLSEKLGYTGAALKACKGQSHMMIIASLAEKHKMFLCVQDLTCPGASLIQSASLAADMYPGVVAIEANSRQFMPIANKAWETRFPGIFRITDGTMDTSELNKAGIGACGRLRLTAFPGAVQRAAEPRLCRYAEIVQKHLGAVVSSQSGDISAGVATGAAQVQVLEYVRGNGPRRKGPIVTNLAICECAHQ